MGTPRQATEAAEAADRAIDAAQARANVSPSQPVAVEPAPIAEEVVPAKPEAPKVEPVAKVAPVALSLQEQLNREIQLRKTLEGRIRTQLKPANEANRLLREELKELREMILKKDNESLRPGVERLLTDEERNELGTDVIDLNSRMMKGVLEEELSPEKIAMAVEAVMKHNRETNDEPSGPSDGFWSLVDQYCPGALELNSSSDEQWIAHLDSYDARTGELNRDVAQQAISDDDPMALADMFVNFMRLNGMVQEDAPAATRVPKPNSAPRAEVAPAAVAPGVDKWTRAEVNAFYTDISKGKFKGREAEAAKLEDSIMTAAAAGEIT